MTGEPNDGDPLNVNIHESDGMRAVEGLCSSSDQFLSPLKIKKFNIGSTENPKFTNIGDYWDEEIVGKITDLFYEFQDTLSVFSEMKGIVGNIGEMKIPSNPNTKPVKHQPYRLNPRYKEKVKVELDQIVEVGVI